MASPLFSLDDLTTPLTREQVQASIYRVLGKVGVDTSTWKSGAVVRTMIVGVSLVLASFSTLQAQIARMGFLELAEKKWLTLVARYVYGVERRDATFATGEVTLTNSKGGVFDLDPSDLIVRNPKTGKTYRNTSRILLGSVGSPTATLTVAVVADEAGSGSTAPPGDVTDLTTPLNGVSCTNVSAVVGLDEERDESLRTRCYEQLGALSPFGPWDAYSAAVRNAARADGSVVGVNRVRITKDGYGNVTAYVASASGPVDGELGDTTTDLGAADDAVQRWAAPLAVTAWTKSAIAKPLAISYEVWLYATSGRTPDQIKDAIAARLTSFIASQPIGGNIIGNADGQIYLDAIQAAIASALPEIFHVDVQVGDSSEGALELLPYEVAVLAGTPVSRGVHQVSPPEGLAA